MLKISTLEYLQLNKNIEIKEGQIWKDCVDNVLVEIYSVSFSKGLLTVKPIESIKGNYCNYYSHEYFRKNFKIIKEKVK